MDARIDELGREIPRQPREDPRHVQGSHDGPPPQQDDNQEPEQLVFKSAAALNGRHVPPRRWLVKGLVPMGTVTLLSGDGGTGKSLLALQLAAATATGRFWMGLGLEETGPCLFLSAEDDDDELHRRMDDIGKAMGSTWGDLSGLNLLSLAGQDALLATLQRGGALKETPLFKALDAAVTQHQPRLVVLDTLADMFPGNENDRAQARQFVGMLRGLAIRHECAVILLSHPSLTGLNSGTGTSGSTGWNNSVRSRLYLERVTTFDEGKPHEDDPDKRRLKGMKSNYAQNGHEITMTWKDGVFEADEGPATGLDRKAAEIGAERTFMRLLDEFAKEGRFVKSAKASQYAAKEFATSGRADGLTKNALHRAMERLFAKGEIVEVLGGSGPPSRHTKRIVRA